MRCMHNTYLVGKADVHLIDVHPDRFKVQSLGTTAAAPSFDYRLDKIAEGCGHEYIFIGYANARFVLDLLDQTDNVHGAGSSGEKVGVISDVDFEYFFPNLLEIFSQGFFFFSELNLHLFIP